MKDRWLRQSLQAENATMHTRAYQHDFAWHSCMSDSGVPLEHVEPQVGLEFVEPLKEGNS